MKDSENPLQELTALDWFAVVLVCLGALFCFQFPVFMAPQFAKTLTEIGAPLSNLTQLGMTVWFPLMLGLNPASVLFHALTGKHTLSRRRLFIVAALVMSVAAVGVCLYAFYSPIFALSGNISHGQPGGDRPRVRIL